MITVINKFVYFFLITLCALDHIYGAKLGGIYVIDKDIIMVNVLDGEVTHRDDGTGEKAFYNQHHENDMDTVKEFTPALSVSAASITDNWTISSSDDASYSNGLHPSQCYRKTKMNGQAEQQWVSSDYHYEYTYEHWIYLKLTQPLQQGKNYTVTSATETNIDPSTGSLAYDIFTSVSEAIHINLAGYHPDPTIKAADLYIWMGDGGARDYTSFVNNKVYLFNVSTSQSAEVGKVIFWKKSGNDIYSYNLTRSDVWNADFSSFTSPGTYRLAIEGVGCSQDFKIDNTAFRDPFMVSVQGFFYMRIGQDSSANIRPVPRRPLYIPGVSPENTVVYLTTMHPYHAQWSSFSNGDVWDKPNDWSAFKCTGNPTNSRAYGGHSDALDWDRHLGHICTIWDMLLPFLLTNGAINDDNLDIAESGNGIPDIIDEARNEVDFWLRLRDGQGYSHGLTNPNNKNELFQAAPTAIAAWANAANSAMLSDCFRVCAKDDLKAEYRDSAVAAFNFANSLSDQMLDITHSTGDITVRGRDLKMMAAAFLYNVTGDTTYESIVNQESVVSDNNSILVESQKKNQLYATAAYLVSPQPIHYQQLFDNMKASVISQAKSLEVALSEKRPSRRSTQESSWYFRTTQNVHHSIVAHAVTTSTDEKALFRKSTVLEADYGLGRNPMNMIQMTTASTPLESKRSVPRAYTSGGDDGTPGMHPGHTPYMNLNDWSSMTMGSPSKLYSNCYPADFKKNWPIGEGYFNTSYVWAHNEFTPQQTMSGKMALYGYLYGITKGTSAINARFRYNSFTEHPSAVTKFNATKVRIIDLCGRVIWSGTEIDYSKLSKLNQLANRTLLIEKSNASQRSIRVLTLQK